MNQLDIQKELSDIFFAETGDLLSDASGALLAAETAGNPGGAVHQVFRAVHSIKGGAQTMDLHHLAEVAHVAEDLLDPVRQGVSEADSMLVSLMLEAFDLMEGQLSAYRTGSGLDHLAERKEEYLRSAAEVQKVLKAGQAAGEKVVVTRREKQVKSGGSRLLYMYFLIDPAAPMAQVRLFLLLERLLDSGDVLYSQPGRDELEMDAPDTETVDLKVVLQTDLNDKALRQVCDVGDVKDMRLVELEPGICSSGFVPSVAEVERFNLAAARLYRALENQKADDDYICRLALDLSEWGEKNTGEAGWFPGGLRVWRRRAALLAQAVHTQAYGLAAGFLETLWEEVYDNLCNRIYFYSLPVHAARGIAGLNAGGQAIAPAADARVAVVDISQVEFLEPADLRVLAKVKEGLAAGGMRLVLLSGGPFTRRHANVIEATEQLVGGLPVFSSPFRACCAAGETDLTKLEE